jgi:hypothetical protein
MRVYKDEDRHIEHMDNITDPSISNMISSSLSSFICIFVIVMIFAVLKLVKRK